MKRPWLVFISSLAEICLTIKVQIVDFLKDFTNASSRAQALDSRILQNATSVSTYLGGLVSVAIAQVYGSMQMTVGTDAQDVMIFMKNIGGFGAK
jgi:hypothetical protein